MGIEAITEKIVNDATGYAAELVSEAETEAGKIIAEAVWKAEDIIGQTDARGAKDTTMIIHRKHAAAELEARKMRLATKQELVANAVRSAVDWLADMEQKDYIEFLADTLIGTGVKEGELILNERDKKTIGKKLVKSANEKVEEGRFTLSSRTMDAKGGYILKYGATEINATLEVMVASVKEKVAQKVVKILFKEYEI